MSNVMTDDKRPIETCKACGVELIYKDRKTRIEVFTSSDIDQHNLMHKQSGYCRSCYWRFIETVRVALGANPDGTERQKEDVARCRR